MATSSNSPSGGGKQKLSRIGRYGLSSGSFKDKFGTSSSPSYPPRISLTTSSGSFSSLSPSSGTETQGKTSRSVHRQRSLKEPPSPTESHNRSPRSSLNRIGDNLQSYASRYLDSIRPKWSSSSSSSNHVAASSASSSRSESPHNTPHLLTFRQPNRLSPSTFSGSNPRSLSTSPLPSSSGGSSSWRTSPSTSSKSERYNLVPCLATDPHLLEAFFLNKTSWSFAGGSGTLLRPAMLTKRVRIGVEAGVMEVKTGWTLELIIWEFLVAAVLTANLRKVSLLDGHTLSMSNLLRVENLIRKDSHLLHLRTGELKTPSPRKQVSLVQSWFLWATIGNCTNIWGSMVY